MIRIDGSFYQSFFTGRNFGTSSAKTFLGDKGTPIQGINSYDIVSISNTSRQKGARSTLNPTGTDSIADRKAFKIHRSDSDAKLNGILALVDRFTGNAVGTTRKSHEDIWSSTSGAYESAEDEMVAQQRAMETQQSLFNSLLSQASREREKISTDIKQLLERNGIKLSESDTIDFKINDKNEIRVTGAGKSLNTEKIEGILNSDKALCQRMLKNSAISSMQHYRKSDTGTPTLNSSEKVLVDIYLKEQIGYGLKDISNRGNGLDGWGVDGDLDSLLTSDPILDEQIAIYLSQPDLDFEATWTYGNGHVADRSNSAESLLPTQGLGTFAEKLIAGKNDVYEVTLANGTGITTGISDNNSEAEATEKMAAMDGLLGQAGAGMDVILQAAERAMEEYLVRHDTNKENLETKVIIRDGQWKIRIEEKSLPPKNGSN